MTPEGDLRRSKGKGTHDQLREGDIPQGSGSQSRVSGPVSSISSGTSLEMQISGLAPVLWNQKQDGAQQPMFLTGPAGNSDLQFKFKNLCPAVSQSVPLTYCLLLLSKHLVAPDAVQQWPETAPGSAH